MPPGLIHRYRKIPEVAAFIFSRVSNRASCAKLSHFVKPQTAGPSVLSERVKLAQGDFIALSCRRVGYDLGAGLEWTIFLTS